MYYESLTYISVNTICPAMFWSYRPKRAKTPAIESKVEGRLTLVACNEFRPHMTQLLKSGKKNFGRLKVGKLASLDADPHSRLFSDQKSLADTNNRLRKLFWRFLSMLRKSIEIF